MGEMDNTSMNLNPEILQVKLSEIKLWDKNPRSITKDAMSGLRNSIAKFGYVDLLIVNKRNMELISGHQRFKILSETEIESVPVVMVDLDMQQQEALALTMNNQAIMGEWTQELLDVLARLQAEIPQDYVDLRLEALRSEIKETKPDETIIDPDFTEPTANTTTDIVQGDLFEIVAGGGLMHRLLCGSSTDKSHVEKLMDGHQVDMMLTDPPYNVDYEGGTGMKIMNDHMKDSKFFQFLFDFYTIWSGVTKQGGAWYVWHNDREGYNFRRAFRESGLLLKQCLIWIKNSFVMCRQDYQWKHEACLYGWKEGAAHYFVNDHTNATVIDYDQDFSKLKKEELLQIIEKIMSETKTTLLHHNKPMKSGLHPTMKPILLFAELIYNSSRPGEIIGDAFLGSGSTMVAAHQMKRNCYGMELDPRYCKVIIDRMKTLEPEIKILKNGQIYA